MIDWPRVLIELGGRGLTLEGIAETIGAPRTTVIGWKNGNHEPRYTDGNALMNLWRKTMATPPELRLEGTGRRVKRAG